MPGSESLLGREAALNTHLQGSSEKKSFRF